MGSVTFRVHYATQWGENLYLEHPAEGKEQSRHVLMHPAGGGFWSVRLDGAEIGKIIEYRYLCRGTDGNYRREPSFRRLELSPSELVVWDHFLAPELPEGAFLRQAFAGVIFNPSRETPTPGPTEGRGLLRITIRAPRVRVGQRLCISGEHQLLGNWNPAAARVMGGSNYPIWELNLPASEFAHPTEFKFGLWDERQQRLSEWEEGPNRMFHGVPPGIATLVINYEHLRHPHVWRGAGVAIPVFSLRTEHSYGIGEFTDLASFAQWAARCGLQLVQVLPVNDTSSDYTWRDSYPYKAISTAALHPIYINVGRLFAEYGVPLPDVYHGKRESLNNLLQVDYETVIKDKLDYLRGLFRVVGAGAPPGSAPAPEPPSPGSIVRGVTAGFEKYRQEQDHWLKPYAAFCRLRDLHGTADFSQWNAHAKYCAAEVERWFEPDAAEYEAVMFHCWVQFHLDRQLSAALATGHSLGVAFKGDLPIGVNRSSVEAWTEPDLFRTDRQTGAPPDAFAVLGQNWGFPTYNWSRMEADGYSWWRKRFARMSAAFDALRIDHILGFFRIWEIPQQYREGIMGHFHPALPLGREEIRNAGFRLNPADFTAGSVAEAALPEFFGSAARKVRDHLLEPGKDSFFRLRPEFAFPDARRAWYTEELTEAAAAGVEAGLTRLGFEVLFLEDPDMPGRFHPRINLPDTVLFKSLGEETQAALIQLHHDFYFRRHTQFWVDEAMKKLPALMDASPMLICGEDLGMVPDSVPVVLKRLGLLSLEVQRWPKVLDLRLGNPAEYPYLSVSTTSTHDMSTVRGWWEEEAETRQYFWNSIMGREGVAPANCSGAICRFILEQNLCGASMWCILPLQDWLGIEEGLRRPVAAEERINVPAISHHYWRYRMHLNIEELMRAEEFNRSVVELVVGSRRNRNSGEGSRIGSRSSAPPAELPGTLGLTST